MLGCYLTWHLRQAWAPLTFTAHTRTHPPRATTWPRRTAPRQLGIPGAKAGSAGSSGAGEAKAGQGVDDLRVG
jgi:hypothetical protein